MSVELLLPEATVKVTCPVLDIPMQVRVTRDEYGQAHLCGCARYWGKLHCDGACEESAIAELHAAETAKAVALTKAVYCGHPNLAAPRPRELEPAGA